MINNLELFLKEANECLSALAEYGEATDRLSQVDLQQEDVALAIDDISAIVLKREEIKERAESAQNAMVQAIWEQSEDDIKLIKSAFSGEEITYSITGDRRLAKEVIFKLLALQKDIIEKDNAMISKLTAKQNEIKVALKGLRGDKKKLDFLNVTAAVGQEAPGFEA